MIIPIECGHHQKKLEIPILQQPKSQQSMSELKPPTMNSSFLFNGMSSPRLEENNQSSFLQQKSNRFEETEVKAMKKSKFHEEMMSKSLKERNIEKQPINNKLAQKFILNLKHSTFLLKEKLLNQFQQKILTEKYLESDIYEKVSKLNLLMNMIWEVLFLIVQVIAFSYLPFVVGFQLENNYFISGIIMIQIMGDLLISALQKQLRSKQYVIDFILLLSNALIIMRKITDECLFIALIFQLLTSLSKFEIKFQKWQDYIPYDLFNIRFIARVLVLLHYCACLWHFIGISQQESWITEQLNHESDSFTRYCYSIYWSSASLLHIGQTNIIPITEIEFIYSVFMMLISCWIMASFFKHAFQCTDLTHDKEQLLRKQLKLVNNFFQDKKISFLIKSQIRNFIKSNITEANEKQISSIISQLSPQLTEELLFQMRTDALLKCKFVQRFSSLTQLKLTKYMEYITLGQGKEIETDLSFYLIESGKIQVIEYGKVIQNLKSGDSFGEYSFFSGTRVSTMFKVIEQTSLYKIKQEDFIKLIYQNKQDYEKFMFLKDQLLNGSCSVIHIFCNFCKSGMHPFSDCPFLNYKPNLLNLVKKASSGTQERRRFKRDFDINYRIFNRVLKRHKINTEALNIFRIKMNLSFLDDSSDQSEEDFSSDSDVSDDQQYTNNKTSDNYKDGTAISILKSNDYINENMKHSVQEVDEMIKINSNQEAQTGYGLQLPQFQIALVPVDNTKKSQTQIDQTCSQQIFSDWHIPSATKIKQPSKNDLRQSARKISSKLSTIKHIQSGTVFKSNMNPYSKSILQLPNSHELVDLSMYKGNSNQDEFEVMFQFNIYYPSWNYSKVIKRLNNQLNRRLKALSQGQLFSRYKSNSQLQSKGDE